MSMPKSARGPRKRVAVALVALALGLLGTTSPASAEAVTQQGICSSRGSVIGSVIELKDVSSGLTTAKLYRGECTFIHRGTTRVVYSGAKSYRVGYNFGPYSKDCRSNNGFVPWTKPDTIYFRLYTTSSCVNP